jgi:hypothetical protein
MQKEKRNTKETFRMEEIILPKHMFRSNIKLDIIFDKMVQYDSENVKFGQFVRPL